MAEVAEVAVVTGASRGIGAAAAVELGRRGYRVVVNYRSRADAAQEVVAAVRQAGGDGIAVPGDVCDPDQARRVVAAAVDTYGGLDALVCNASAPVRPTPFADLEFADLAGVVTGELAATFHPVRAAEPHLAARGGGRIVVVSSAMAARYAFGAGLAHGVAKAALNAFASYLAVRYGPAGITVNVVAPSYVRTEGSSVNIPAGFEQARAGETPLRRICLPVDVGRVIAQLAANRDGYVTGVCVPVTGGRHLV